MGLIWRDFDSLGFHGLHELSRKPFVLKSAVKNNPNMTTGSSNDFLQQEFSKHFRNLKPPYGSFFRQSIPSDHPAQRQYMLWRFLGAQLEEMRNELGDRLFWLYTDVINTGEDDHVRTLCTTTSFFHDGE